jgi:hypothetical protein
LEKLKTLCLLLDTGLLIMIRVIISTGDESEAGRKLSEWVVDHLAESFWTLMDDK